jgi:hypothetical protein
MDVGGLGFVLDTVAPHLGFLVVPCFDHVGVVGAVGCEEQVLAGRKHGAVGLDAVMRGNDPFVPVGAHDDGVTFIGFDLGAILQDGVTEGGFAVFEGVHKVAPHRRSDHEVEVELMHLGCDGVDHGFKDGVGFVGGKFAGLYSSDNARGGECTSAGYSSRESEFLSFGL